jgi:hypothetical protein
VDDLQREERITAAEVKLMRRRAGHIGMDRERNTDIVKKLNTEQIMNFIQTYRGNWKNHVLRMPR